MNKKVILTCVLLIGALSLIAQQNTWNGNVNNLWSNAENWSHGVPTAAHDVVIPNTTNRPYLTDSSLVTGNCKSLTIQSGGIMYIGNGFLNVTNNVLIQGTLNYYSSTTLDPTIALGGNWTRSGTFNHNNNGRVIFNGAGHQYVYSNENFSTLVVNNGAALRINNASRVVTCNVYDWQAGGIDVLSGTFTAHDLAQNGLYGGFWVNENGTINLTNSTGSTWVDLRGSVNILGGTMNLTGTYADFPYANGANFTMTGGVLDIKTCDLRIMSGYTWTNNITGGTIRLARGYDSQRADFTPAAGIFEFYGNTDFTINQTSGSTLHNVKINKAVATRDEENSMPSGPIYDERSGMLLSDGTRANTITLASNFTTTGYLEILAGSTFDIGSRTCNVGGYLDIYGNLTFGTTDTPTMNVDGSVLWFEGATANISNGQFNIKSDWWFANDGSIHLDGSTVNFNGSVNQSINGVYHDSRFGDVTINQTGVSSTILERGSILVAGNLTIPNGRKFILVEDYHWADLTVNGNLDLSGTLEIAGGSGGSPWMNVTVNGEMNFPSTGWLDINFASFICNYTTTGSTTLSGKLTMDYASTFSYPNASVIIAPSFVPEISHATLRFGKNFTQAPGGGVFQLIAGTMEFFGSGIHFLSLLSTAELSNLTINKTSGQLYLITDINVRNNIYIQAGTFDSNNYNIQVGSNWINYSSFLPKTGKVTFNGGNYNQACTNTTFNILEVNKPLGGLLTMDNATVTCASYDWTAGGISVTGGGTFTANDLADNGLFGSYSVTNGTMNLYQDSSQYIDFAGDITVGINGILNIYGGSGSSYWPYFNSASLTMSGNAILDIKDQGIYVNNGHEFATNITGGTIRTSGNFYNERADFTPAAGTLEFYGNNDTSITQNAGSLHHVKINKASATRSEEDFVVSGPIYDERSGMLLSDGTRANTISLNNNFTTTGNLEIIAGSIFNINAYTCNIGGRTDVYGNLTFAAAGSPTMNVDGYFVWQSGSTESISHGQFNVRSFWYFQSGANVYLDGSTVNFNGSVSQQIYTHDNDSRFGHVTINQTGATTVTLIVSSNNAMRVAGNMTIPSGRKFIIDSSRTLAVDGTLALSGTLEMAGSSITTIGGEVNYPATGWLNLNNSTFTCNYTTAGTTTLYGKLTMNNGSLFSYPNATVAISPAFVQEVSGGTLRFGKSLYASGPGTFQLSAGTTEFVGSGTHYFGFHADNYLSNVKINKTSGTLMLTTNLKASSMVISDGTLDLGSYSCNITGTTDIYGTLAMTNAANDLTANEINWNSGSNDNVTAGTFHANDWRFNEGTNAKLGTGNTAYLNNLWYPTDDDAEFGNLVAVSSSVLLRDDDVTKAHYPVRVAGDFFINTGAAWNFNNDSVDLIIDGDAYIDEGSILNFWNGANLDVGGYLSTDGTLRIDDGIGSAGIMVLNETGWLELVNSTFINSTAASSSLLGRLFMDDDSVLDFSAASLVIGETFVNEIEGGIIRVGHALRAIHPGTFELWWGTTVCGDSDPLLFDPYVEVTNGNHLYNMTVDKNLATLRVYDSLHLKGSMLIESGELIVVDETISLEGNWTNNAYPNGFTPGTGRVIFNGNYAQSSSSEDYNILEVAKTGVSWFSNHAGAAITCQVYDYTSVGIWIEDGSFTAYDLADNGLYGDIIAYHNSTIDLHQDAGQFVDLCGRIIVYPTGTLNIHGGSHNSYWPYGNVAEITMSGGVLDFKDVGIHLNDTHTLTSNITGGTIRTAGKFSGVRNDFHPTGGTVELYGSADATVSQGAAYTFYNLTINKAARNEESAFTSLRYDRTGKELPLKTRANTVELGSNLMVTNDLSVNAGTFDLNGNQLSVQNNVAVNSGGVLDINSGAVLRLADAKTLSVNNGGTLRAIGDDVSNATITHILGTYNLNVENGGTIAAQHAIFEYMRTNGVYVKSGALVDPTYSFHYCTFRNGAVDGRLLQLDNSQTITINGTVFPENTWGGLYNVAKFFDAGSVTFTDFSGDFSGSDYENDNFNRIHWSTGILPAPTNLAIQIVGGNIQLNWDAVVGATSYKVYSSDSPTGTFNPDLSGSFSGTTWTASVSSAKKFYRVTAVN